MTRTERNPFPAAVQKDKHSRSGLVKSESLRKQGAGAHNWGSFKEEGAYKSQADADAADEQAIFAMEEQGDAVPPLNTKQTLDPILDTSVGNGDVEGNKGIAHSPSDSMSSIDSVQSNGKAGQRRMSNVSDEERERARVYREGVMGRGPIDLAGIAKTSYGIAQSPPNNSVFGTSPTSRK